MEVESRFRELVQSIQYKSAYQPHPTTLQRAMYDYVALKI